jgi:hypothetical protein
MTGSALAKLKINLELERTPTVLLDVIIFFGM